MNLLLFGLFVVGILHSVLAGPEFNFEDPSQISAFVAAKSTRAITQSYFKTGSKSLLWQWAAGNQAKLTIQLGASLKLKDKELRKGGIKFWMYRERATPSSTMEITFQGENGSGQVVTTTPTRATLNFQGWRGVWIGYEEFGSEMTPFTSITNVDFKITTTQGDKLYLDAVRFVPSLRKQSRDIIVQKVGSSVRSSDPSFYDDKDFWQQSLRWHLEGASRSTTPVTNVDTKHSEIQAIENQLQNWYVNERETLKTITKYDDFAVDMAMDPDGGIDFAALKQKRWQFLQKDIEAANTYYSKIDFEHSRPPLFSKVEELGEDGITDEPNCMSKFGFFFARILLPLSLEYNFMSRPAEVNALGNKVCTRLKSTDYLTMLRAITEITGEDQLLVGDFQTILQTYKSKLNCASSRSDEEFSAADLISIYNHLVRWERIKTLLLYIEKQGWAEGSGLGSLDHEMNKAGSGFMHSMFLLRHALQKTENAALLNRLIKAMKWYNDFNEIYQSESKYVYDGTTADRMRTICLYRLMIILITPETNKENKVRDMGYFTTWMKHGLRINKGLGGLIKPDFTGFHHKTFYGSAYVPHALHNAALVQYLLEVTSSFKLDQASKDNLREALKVMRIIAVKYSSPNSIGGRFPGYNNAILAKHFAAYAYISYEKKGNTERANGRDIFLRLFQHTEPSVKAYLEDGTIVSGIYYWNTIGQIDVFQKISTLNCSSQCTAENSPTGHWSKNFAALSIHRRNNWTVVAKGFNRYTWDYESSPKENVFGAFASHGSLQISNSEASLLRNDVSYGWDWTRVPGATTIKAELVNIVLGKARNYNPGNFSGGVSFTGSVGSSPRNGAFGMFFKKPKYEMKNKASPMGTMEFEFKKSYFFYNDLIVCLGSDIKFKNRDIDNYYAQTTLFQDKLQDATKPTTITIDSKTHDLRLLLKRQYRWTTGKTIRLVDTNGNTYQVKTAKTQGLNVEVLDQESVQTGGCEKTKARYATAWLEHKQKQALSCGTTTVVSLVKTTAPNKITTAKIHDKPKHLSINKYRENINTMSFRDNNIAENIRHSSLRGKDKQKVAKEKMSNIKKENGKKNVQNKPENHNKIIDIPTTNIKEINKTDSKKETNDYMYVNGVNINATSEPKSDVVKDQDEDHDDTVLDAEQWNSANENNIDEGTPETSDVDRYADTEITNSDDDKGYIDDEEMDGLGTDIDYENDDSTAQMRKHENEGTGDKVTATSDKQANREKTNEKTQEEDLERENIRIGSNIDMQKKSNDLLRSEKKMPEKPTKHVITKDENIDRKFEEMNTDEDNDRQSSQRSPEKSDMTTSMDMVDKQNTHVNASIDNNSNDDWKHTQINKRVDKNQNVKENEEHINAKVDNDEPIENTSVKNVNNVEGRKTQVVPKSDDNVENDEQNGRVNSNTDKDKHVKLKKTQVNDSTDNDENNAQQKTQHDACADNDENVEQPKPQVNASADNNENAEQTKTQVNASVENEKNVENPNTQVNASADNDENVEQPKTQVNASFDNDENVKNRKTEVRYSSSDDNENDKQQSSVSDQQKNSKTRITKRVKNAGKDENDGKKYGKENLQNLNTKIKFTGQTINTKDHDDKADNLEDKAIGTDEELSSNISNNVNPDHSHENNKGSGQIDLKNKNNLKGKKSDLKNGKVKKDPEDDKQEVNGNGSNYERERTTRYGKSIKLKLKEKKIYYNKINKVMEVAIKKAKHLRHNREKVEELPKAIDNAYYNYSLASDSSTNMEIEESQTDDDNYTTASETSSYEYAILIHGGNLNMFAKYKVFQASGKAHAVEFSNMPDLPNTTKVFSYSIFEAQKATESISSGPVKRASAPCMIMAELGASTLYLAVSNPAITFQDDQAAKDKERCTRKGRKDVRDKFSPKNSDEVGAKMMFCVEGKRTSITVALRLEGKSLGSAAGAVKVDGKKITNLAAYISIDAAKNEVTFLNLVNGLTTEVLLSHAFVSPKSGKK